MLDKKDAKILDLLRQDGKLTTGAIARKTAIPVTTVHNRIKRMERDGIIAGYAATVDHAKLGRPILALILVTVTYQLPGGRKVSQMEMAKRIKALGAEEVVIVTGGVDILVRLRVSSVEELNAFIVDRLRTVDGVDKTQTMIALDCL